GFGIQTYPREIFFSISTWLCVNRRAPKVKVESDRPYCHGQGNPAGRREGNNLNLPIQMLLRTRYVISSAKTLERGRIEKEEVPMYDRRKFAKLFASVPVTAGLAALAQRAPGQQPPPASPAKPAAGK